VGIGQVRQLSAGLALMPVEGGARVAIVETAHRLNEDAQNAFLKILEEPPDGVVLILCADDEERLLPTVRSRCARIRLGQVGSRAIEELLGELGLAEPPDAARLARIAAGRPGLAVSYAAAPEAVRGRLAIARGLLDLGRERRSGRLSAIRALAAQAEEVLEALERAAAADGPAAEGGASRARSSRARSGRTRPAAGPPQVEATVTDGSGEAEGGSPARSSAAARRRSAALVLEVWRDLFRDVAMLASGVPKLVRELDLLDELQAASALVEAIEIDRFLDELARAAERLEANASPELLLDAVALVAPRPRAAG
jgi:hypothetical protein